MPLFVIDTLVQFRHKYAVEANSLDEACEFIKKCNFENNEEELTQRYLGETIIGGQEITKDDFNKLVESLAKDSNESSSYWLGDEIILKATENN